jgi:hypothetical protein
MEVRALNGCAAPAATGAPLQAGRARMRARWGVGPRVGRRDAKLLTLTGGPPGPLGLAICIGFRPTSY